MNKPLKLDRTSLSYTFIRVGKRSHFLSIRDVDVDWNDSMHGYEVSISGRTSGWGNGVAAEVTLAFDSKEKLQDFVNEMSEAVEKISQNLRL